MTAAFFIENPDKSTLKLWENKLTSYYLGKRLENVEIQETKDYCSPLSKKMKIKAYKNIT